MLHPDPAGVWHRAAEPCTQMLQQLRAQLQSAGAERLQITPAFCPRGVILNAGHVQVCVHMRNFLFSSDFCLFLLALG